MKILQILPELKVGGVETGTVDLAKYLIEHGHRAVVVSNGGPLVAELEKLGVNHYVLPVHQKDIFTMRSCIKKLEKIIVAEGVDIVHARSRVPAWIAFFACRRTSAEFLTTCHGYYGSHLFSQVMGWAKRVIVPSTVIGQHMVEHFKVPKENIRLIPRSVDVERFSVPRETLEGQSSFTIAIVGRLTPLKGHTFFLQAMAKVVRFMPFVKIWVIGDAPDNKESYRQELELLVKHLGLVDHVEFLGNRRDIPELLARTDVVVLSTVTQEAFGRVILEAQCAGAAVVATRVGGVVEIIDDGETGLLVPPRDPDAIAQQVLRLLKDRKLAQSLVSNAQQKIQEQFTLERMASQTIRVYEELLTSHHILVIKLTSIGDVVLATASLKALRAKFPKAKIYCLVSQSCREVLSRCPYLDGVIIFDAKDRDRGLGGLWRLSRRLRQYKFDKVIDLQNNRKSHLLSFLSFPKESFGYAGKWGLLLTQRLKNRKERIHPVQHQFKVLNLLGIDYQGTERLELWPSRSDEQYIQELLETEWVGNFGNLIGYNFSASAQWPTKNWPLAHLARLCDLLSVHNYRVVLTGTERDRDAAQQLLKMSKSKPAILAGKTDLGQLTALIKRCKVFVTADSSPLHIAAAVGTPAVALFGPTDPARHLPPAKVVKVLKKDLPCTPCYSGQCKIKTHACMLAIAPEEVLEQIKQALGGRW